jgi:hypothetical protein
MSGPKLPERLALEARWLEMTRVTLPALAVARGWPVSDDHCFQRILLDNACGRCWYEVIAERPAYANAPDDVLAGAVALGEAAFAGADLDRLNANSLQWRGRRNVSLGKCERAD